MKFSISTILSLASLATAAPAAVPAPAPQSSSGAAIIAPTVVSNYEVWTGAIRYNTGIGRVFKNGRTTDISTLLTFTFPAAAAGRTCTINISLDAASTQTGARDIDIFSSLAPAPGARASWPPGNQRNLQLGRVRVNKPGSGVYQAGYPVVGRSYPCPAAGTVAGYELVATDDTTNTQFTQGAGVGAFITYV